MVAKLHNSEGTNYLKIPNVLVAVIVTIVAACGAAWLNMHAKVANVDKKVDVLQVYQETDHQKLMEISEDVKALANRFGVPTSSASPTLLDNMQDAKDAADDKVAYKRN